MAAQDTPRIEEPRRAAGSLAESDSRETKRAASAHDQADLAAWSIVALLGLGGFAVMTLLVAGKTAFPFDQPLLDAAGQLSQYTVAWRDLSNSANYPLIAVGVAIVLGLLLLRRWKAAAIVVVLLIAVTAGSEVVKQLVARPRPPGYDESTLGVVYSYPSGHVLEAVTLYGVISVLVWRSRLPTIWRILIPCALAVFVASVAIARVASGAHFPSDVLASAMGGIGFVAIFAVLSAILERSRHGPAPEKDD